MHANPSLTTCKSIIPFLTPDVIASPCVSLPHVPHVSSNGPLIETTFQDEDHLLLPLLLFHLFSLLAQKQQVKPIAKCSKSRVAIGSSLVAPLTVVRSWDGNRRSVVVKKGRKSWSRFAVRCMRVVNHELRVRQSSSS